jgi:hypothetical protein
MNITIMHQISSQRPNSYLCLFIACFRLPEVLTLGSSNEAVDKDDDERQRGLLTRQPQVLGQILGEKSPFRRCEVGSIRLRFQCTTRSRTG